MNEVALTGPPPTRAFRLRPVLLVTLGPALLVLSFGLGNRWLTLVACLGMAALGVAVATLPRLSALTVQVQVPARSRVGDVVEHVVQVRNTAATACSCLVLHLGGDGFADVHVGVPALAAGAGTTLRIPRRAERRCRSAGPLVLVEGGDSLGLLTGQRTAFVPAPVFVHPAPAPVPPVPPPPVRSTDDLAGIRPYRRGDRLSQVHRRASARRAAATGAADGGLVVVEREGAPTGALVVVLDAPADGTADGWEGLVAAAAALVRRELAAHRPVVLLTADGPARGGAALDALATAQPAPAGPVAARALAGPDGHVVVGELGEGGPVWRAG